MREKDIIIMTVKELKRLNVINKVLDKQMTQEKAAKLLDLTDRQIRRITKRVKEEGQKGIIHQSRGRSSNRLLPVCLKAQVLKLYKAKYLGFGPTLAREKLMEIEDIKVGRETLRHWLLEADLWKRKRRARNHCKWRERKECFGQMVILDGSHHDWLESRGEELVLMGYIDDATGNFYGKFYDYEGTMPALDGLKEYINQHGIPLSLYVDKHSTYLVNRKLTIEEELKGTKKPLTQFERACKELGIEVIHANSPQAKGRIEREFGVLQDRLVKEMRLAGINTKEEANKFLLSYLTSRNKRFNVKPAKDDNIHVDVPAHINLEQILCIKKRRCLRKDNTISYGGRLYFIEQRLTSKTVTVEQRTDDSIHLSCKGEYLNYKEVETRPKANLVTAKIQNDRKPYIPPADHPWKKRSYEIMLKKKEVACLTK